MRKTRNKDGPEIDVGNIGTLYCRKEITVRPRDGTAKRICSKAVSFLWHPVIQRKVISGMIGFQMEYLIQSEIKIRGRTRFRRRKSHYRNRYLEPVMGEVCPDNNNNILSK